MRRTRLGVLAVGGGLLGVLLSQTTANAGFLTISLTAGLSGGTSATGTANFQVTTPPNSVVAITQVSAGDTIRAITGGGISFFSGAGTPVILNLSNGGVVLASSNAADASIPGNIATATASPVAGGDVPTGADQLGLTLTQNAEDGSAVLAARVTNQAGDSLGGTQVTVPAGGWWVLGLGPDGQSSPPPPPVDPPPVVPPPVTTPSGPSNSPPPTTPPGAESPEPSGLVLAGIGGVVALARRVRRPSAT